MNDEVTAGAATRNGPRWTSGGALMSTTVTAAIRAKGIATSAFECRRVAWSERRNRCDFIVPEYLRPSAAALSVPAVPGAGTAVRALPHPGSHARGSTRQ